MGKIGVHFLGGSAQRTRKKDTETLRSVNRAKKTKQWGQWKGRHNRCQVSTLFMPCFTITVQAQPTSQPNSKLVQPAKLIKETCLRALPCLLLCPLFTLIIPLRCFHLSAPTLILFLCPSSRIANSSKSTTAIAYQLFSLITSGYKYKQQHTRCF